jgi:hypothetical protein
VSTAAGPSSDRGFGGKIPASSSWRGARYERVALPSEGDVGDDDDFGGDDEEEDAPRERPQARSVLTQLIVQRTSGGARLGVLVDGGARYHVGRRGRDRLVLTLLDTRARDLDVRRTLDARPLGGPILKVSPSVEEDRRFRIELMIDTRGPAPVQVQQEGPVLWVEVRE